MSVLRGLTFELRGRSQNDPWPAKRSIEQQRFAGQVPCRWRSRSSEGLGSSLGVLGGLGVLPLNCLGNTQRSARMREAPRLLVEAAPEPIAEGGEQTDPCEGRAADDEHDVAKVAEARTEEQGTVGCRVKSNTRQEWRGDKLSVLKRRYMCKRITQ